MTTPVAEPQEPSEEVPYVSPVVAAAQSGEQVDFGASVEAEAELANVDAEADLAAIDPQE